MSKKLTKIVKYLLIIVGALIALAVIIPLVYKKEIIQYVSNKANEQINGKLSFKDVHISLFKHFPKWSFSATDIILHSYSLPDSAELISAKEISLTVDFWKLMDYKNGYSIQGIYIDQPTVTIFTDTSGLNNYTILKPRSQDSTTKFQLDIENLEISRANLVYRDLVASTLINLSNLDLKSKINQKEDLLLLESKSSIDSLSISYNGIPYLQNVKWISTIQLDYLKKESKIVFKDTEFLLNALQLKAEGEVSSLSNAVTKMDIHIFSPGNSFKDLYSLLPNAYSKHFTNLQATGTYNFDFKAKGLYDGEKEQYPAFGLQCNIKDGSLKYTDKNVAMQDIQLDLKVNNSDPNLKDMEIQISPLQFTLNQRPFKLNTRINRVRDNPNVKGDIVGSISLSDFNNFFPLTKGTELEGILESDLKYEFTREDIELRRFENIYASGMVDGANISYASPGAKTVLIPKAHIELSPKYLLIDPCKVTIGKSDFQIVSKLENPLALLVGKSKTNGSTRIVSSKLDLNELSSSEDDIAASPEIGVIPEFIKSLSTDFQFSGKEIFYDTYHLLNTEAIGSFDFDRLTLTKMNSRINDNAIFINGNINNIAAYIFEDKKIKGNLSLVSENLDLDKLMYTEAAVSETVSESLPFLVPNFMDMAINFNVNKAKYGKIILNKCNGKVIILDEEMQFHGLNSQTMGGLMSLNGVYTSKNTLKPTFDLKYDLSKLKFEQIFNSVQSIKVLAPLAQFIEGVFNSSFVCQGQLGKGMMPDFTTLNLNGIIETLDGAIRNFKPLSELGSKLNLDFLKNLNLKNTKNWIKVENGAVFLKDFKKKIEDIDLEANGKHTISGPMDYEVKFRIPISKFKTITKSSGLESGMSYLKDLASKVGYNLETGTHVNLAVNMTGKLLNPDFKIKILGSDGKSLEESGKDIIADVGTKIKDTLTNRANEEVDKLKKKAIEEQKKIEDSLRVLANKKAQEAKDKLLEEIRKKSGMDSTLTKKGSDAVGSEADKILKEGGKKEVDEIKDKLKEWNPFKKK